jgi:hypothetical protein
VNQIANSDRDVREVVAAWQAVMARRLMPE